MLWILAKNVLFGNEVKDHILFMEGLTRAVTQWQILDSSKLKKFADNNSKFDENCGKFSKWVQNTVEKGKIARNERFLLFPQCFQMTCTADT